VSIVKVHRVWHLLLLTAVVWIPPEGVWAEVPPVRIWGELGYDYRLRDFNGDEHVGLLRLNGFTYLVQPWIAQIQAGIGLSVRDSNFDTNSSSGDFVSGDVRLRLFPMSHFPFEVFAELTDSNTDSDLLDLDVQRFRYGFEQRYTSRQLGSFRLRYEHADRDETSAEKDDGARPVLRTDNSDLWQLSYSKDLERHGFNFDSELINIDRDEARDDTSTLFASLRHRYRPVPNFSMENRITRNSNDLDRKPFRFQTDITELHSLTQWRPSTQKPLHVIGTLRVLQSGTDTEISKSDSVTGTATAGASYQWSDRWRFRANGSVARTQRDDGEGLNSNNLRVGGDYTSSVYKLGSFDYTWFLTPQADHLQDEQGTVETLALEIGHGVNRNWARPNGVGMQLSARQSLADIWDTDGRSTQVLQHNLASTWTQRVGAVSQIVRLSLNDSRTFGGGGRLGDEEREFQLLNLQGTIDYRLNRDASLRGSVSIQTTRSAQPVLGNPVIPDDYSAWRPTSAVNVVFEHRRVFNVPRLLFRSTLDHISDAYLPFVDQSLDPEDRRNTVWENRLEYAIGRLQLRLIGRYTRAKDDDTSLVLFQIRRFFGNI